MSTVADTAAAGLIIAAPRSGAGKTTVALGLMRLLTRQGVPVQPFKCGPDYIDPGFHRAATGRASYNLDTWAMRSGLIAALIARAACGAQMVLVEGVMGLFDGAAGPGQTGNGATADLAALTGWPVVLVLDVSGQTETAAAVALGCRAYRPDLELAGVILNRVASPRQAALIAPAFARCGIAVLGAIGRDPVLALPERHLGLVQADEQVDVAARLDLFADRMQGQVRLDALVAHAKPPRFRAPAVHGAGDDRAVPMPPPGQRIALALDVAFSFTYPHVLQGWRRAGAEILPFSPLADEPPDAGADAVWLPGGYPELHAGRLAAAARFKRGVSELARRGVPVHGECGGYMVLGAGLTDAAGQRHAMLGLLGLETSFAARRLQLGYRRARLLAAGALGAAGDQLYGHEFHYASVLAAPDQALLQVTDAAGLSCAEGGGRRGAVTGSFFHLIDAAGAGVS